MVGLNPCVAIHNDGFDVGSLTRRVLEERRSIWITHLSLSYLAVVPKSSPDETGNEHFDPAPEAFAAVQRQPEPPAMELYRDGGWMPKTAANRFGVSASAPSSSSKHAAGWMSC
jgi:hypothetical protein